MKYVVQIDQGGDTFTDEIEAEEPGEATMKACNSYKGSVSASIDWPMTLDLWYDTEDVFSDEHCERVVEEILDDVEVYDKAPGPEGPWVYKSLEVMRIMNTLVIDDVDGVTLAQIEIPDLSGYDDPHRDLKSYLDDKNEYALDQL